MSRRIRKSTKADRGPAQLPSPKPAISRGWIAVAACIALATFAVYARAIPHPFFELDDPFYVSKNPHVLGGISQWGVKWAFTTFKCCNWHPLTWLSHMLDCTLYGPRPAGHHLTSILLHIANSVLLLFVLWRMTGALWRSAFVAALFALHPLHVQSVCGCQNARMC